MRDHATGSFLSPTREKQMASSVACRTLMSCMTGSMRASPSALSPAEEVRRGILAQIPTIFLSFFCTLSPCVQLCHVTASAPGMISRGRMGDGGGGNLSKHKANWMKPRCVFPGLEELWDCQLGVANTTYSLTFRCHSGVLHNILVDLNHLRNAVDTDPAMPPTFSFTYLGPGLSAHRMNQNSRWQNSLLFPRITSRASDLLSWFPKVISVSKEKRCIKAIRTAITVTGGELKGWSLTPLPFYRWENEDIKKPSDLCKITQLVHDSWDQACHLFISLSRVHHTTLL